MFPEQCTGSKVLWTCFKRVKRSRGKSSDTLPSELTSLGRSDIGRRCTYRDLCTLPYFRRRRERRPLDVSKPLCTATKQGLRYGSKEASHDPSDSCQHTSPNHTNEQHPRWAANHACNCSLYHDKRDATIVAQRFSGRVLGLCGGFMCLFCSGQQHVIANIKLSR